MGSWKVEEGKEYMQGKIRHYRVHLIAYDALLLQQSCLFARLPHPSPTPLAPLVPSISSRYLLQKARQHRPLRKVRLTREQSTIAGL